MLLKTTFLVLMTLGLWAVCSAVRAGDRLTLAPGRAGRSVVMAPHGMVATSQPLAAQIGLDVLQAGRQRRRCRHRHQRRAGPDGADVVRHRRRPVRHRLGRQDARNSTASTPAAGRPTRRRASSSPTRAWTRFPHHGPAELVGARLRRRLGRTAQAVRHACRSSNSWSRRIRYAEEGFPVTEVIAGYWQGAETRLRSDARRRRDLSPRRQRRPRAGDVFKNPDLAAVYRGDRREGPRCLLQGRDRQEHRRLFRARTAACSRSRTSPITPSTWVEPVSTNYRGYRRLGAAAARPGHRRACRCSTCWKATTSRRWGRSRPDYWHLFVEAKKLAYADRAKFLRRPRFRQAADRRADLEAVRRRAPQADRHGQGADQRSPAGDPKLGKATRSTCASWTRTATACR